MCSAEPEALRNHRNYPLQSNHPEPCTHKSSRLSPQRCNRSPVHHSQPRNRHFHRRRPHRNTETNMGPAQHRAQYTLFRTAANAERRAPTPEHKENPVGVGGFVGGNVRRPFVRRAPDNRRDAFAEHSRSQLRGYLRTENNRTLCTGPWPDSVRLQGSVLCSL